MYKRLADDSLKRVLFVLLLTASVHTAGCASHNLGVERADESKTAVSKNCGRNMTQRSKCKKS